MKIITGSNTILNPRLVNGLSYHRGTLLTTEIHYQSQSRKQWKLMLGLSSFALLSLLSIFSCFAASSPVSASAQSKPSQNHFQPNSENDIRVERSVMQQGMQLAQTDRWTRQILNQIDKAANAAVRNGARQTHEPFVGNLGRDADDTVTVTLRKGVSYTILGVCDEHCTDVDLELYDDNGKLISSDTGRNDIPIVNVTPRWNARFTVRVMMPRCTNAPCRYGIGIFGK